MSSKGRMVWEIEQIWQDARRRDGWEASRQLQRVVTFPRNDPCTACGTDPKDDLYPRVGALCHWCDELEKLQHKDCVEKFTGRGGGGRGSGDLGPMRTRGSNSTGPRRAPAIRSTSIRQFLSGRPDTVADVMLCAYFVFVVVMVVTLGGVR